MPRHNKPTRRRAVAKPAPAVVERELSPSSMAVSLVRRGLKSPDILDSGELWRLASFGRPRPVSAERSAS